MKNDPRLAAACPRQDFDARRAEKNEIGYLPQQTQVQKTSRHPCERSFLRVSGRCGSRPFYNKEEKQLAADAMEKMQIAQLAKRCYRELSGGQQQRVLLPARPPPGEDPSRGGGAGAAPAPKAAAEVFAYRKAQPGGRYHRDYDLPRHCRSSQIRQPHSAYRRRRFLRNKDGVSPKPAGTAVAAEKGGGTQ